MLSYEYWKTLKLVIDNKEFKKTRRPYVWLPVTIKHQDTAIGLILHVVFCDWLFSLTIVFSGFTCAVACITYFSLLNNIHWMDMPHFMYTFISWWVSGSLYFLAIMNNAAVNMYAKVCPLMYKFCVDVCFHVLYMYDNSMFSFVRTWQTFLKWLHVSHSRWYIYF